MVEPKSNIPTIFVAFGATGDLMRHKVIPALLYLHNKKELPHMFRVYGFSRRDWSDEQFRDYIREVVEEHTGSSVGDKSLAPFLELFYFQRGTFEDTKSYEELKVAFNRCDAEWRVCANKLFYLAVAPSFYEDIFTHLSQTGLTDPCSPEEGWTRVIVEKPVGVDEKTSRTIEGILSKLFKEEQIYRIDHYLAKEMLQNILTFRFSNNLFEIPWGSELIEKIHMRILENIGVEKRGSFYDSVGAFRDVGQNHLLQMLALVTMRHPSSFEAAMIQRRRAEILKSLDIIQEDEVKKVTFRAQYDGYREIQGVKRDSDIETYFKVQATLSAPEWHGVPIIMEGGKRLGEARKEIIITFKHPSPCLCPAGGGHHNNEVIIRFEPKEEILIEFWTKKLGFSFETERREFHYLLRESSVHVPYVEEYAKLLLDCVSGDQSLFVSSDEVRAMWRFTDPIIDAWRKGRVPLHTYKPDTKGVLEVSKHVDAVLSQSGLKREIGIIGLGKMGANIARRLMERGWIVHGYDPAVSAVDQLGNEGMKAAYSTVELIAHLPKPRLVWLMVPAGKVIDAILFGTTGIAKKLAKGDIIIDGGNSYFKDSVARAKKLSKFGIKYVDVGFSGGPSGARNGGCLMIGGNEETFKKLESLFYDLSLKDGYQFFKGAGAGHFVKMVHNGIEYGMMQAIAEGFAILKKSAYRLALTRVADIYNHGSVIESRLVGWLKKGFEAHGENLSAVSGTVGHTGEGEWTAKTAQEMKVDAEIIEDSFKFRVHSAKKPSFAGKVLSALREQFGGHSIKK